MLKPSGRLHHKLGIEEKEHLDDSVVSELGKFEPEDFQQGKDIELTITQKFEEFEKNRPAKKGSKKAPDEDLAKDSDSS